MATHGFVRRISRSLAGCELLHLPRQHLDVELAARQHAQYTAALESAQVKLTVLPEEPDLPDATFVEDTVIILDEIAVICRLGTPKCQPESQKMAEEAAKIRRTEKIIAPGTLEGGDVLRLGKKLFVGISQRTNEEGVRQFKQLVEPFGYEVCTVAVHGCLHLKTGVTSPAEGILIANPDWIDLSPFCTWEIIPASPAEPWAANTLAINGRVLVTASSPRTASLLASRNLVVQTVDISEIQKAEAGLTCLSVLYSENA